MSQMAFGSGGELIPVRVEIQVDVSKTTNAMLQLQVLVYGILGIMHRLGLPEPFDSAIVKIQRMIATLNMLRLAFISMYAAAGPAGWAIAGIGIAGTVLTGVTMAESMAGY